MLKSHYLINIKEKISKIKESSIIKNIFWLFTDKILRMGIGFIVGVWLARYLGPQNFGILNYAQSFVAVFMQLATLGLDGIVVRDLASNPINKNRILGSAFVLKLIGGIVSFIFIIITVFLVRNDYMGRLLVGILALGNIIQTFDIIDLWFQSQVKSQYTVIAKTSAYIFCALIKVCLIIYQAPLVAFAWLAFLELLLGAVMLVVIYQKKEAALRQWRASVSQCKKLLTESWPLIFSGSFVLINMNSDKIMLGELVNNEAVGIYSAALRLSEMWYFIPLIIGSSVAPKLAKIKYQGNHETYYLFLQKIYALTTKAVLAIILPISLFSKFIIEYIYGNSYVDAANVLTIQIWTVVFVTHISIRSRDWMNENMQLFISGFSCMTMIINILLNFFLLPLYGAIGASISSVVSWGTNALIMPWFFPQTRPAVKMFLASIFSLNKRSI